MNIDYDAIVIGAGIAGMTSAIYLKRSGINCLIIEKEVPGGLLNKVSIIENYPGFISTNGSELSSKVYEQVNNLKIPFLFDEVKEIIDHGDYKMIKLSDKQISTRAIILAIGRKAKTLNKDQEEKLYGKGISFCSLCDGNLYKDEEVAIVGGGNSALEETLYLADICKKVTVIHRRDKFTGESGLIDRVLNKKNVEVLYNSEINKFNSNNNILESIDVKQDNKKINLKVKACFIFIGYEPNTKFLSNLEISDEKGYIITDEFLRTSIKNIYAAGDVVKKDIFQIVTAAADGAKAAVSCIKDLK